MTASTRERLLRGLLVVALLAGVVAVTFGGGYRASHAMLDDASAHVQKKGTVVRVNAEAKSVDARAVRRLAKGGQRLEVVQMSPGVLYVVNNVTGAVWRLPTDSLDPQLVRAAQRKEGPRPRVAAGGGNAYVLDPDGRVTLLEGPSGNRGAQASLPAPATQLVVDGRGTAWALSGHTGELFAVSGGRFVSGHRVSAGGEVVALVLAGGRPVVYRPERGEATMMKADGTPERTIGLPRQDPSDVKAAAPGADSPVLVVVTRRLATLIKADFGTGAVRTSRLAGRERHRFGPPVVSRGRVYVPDYRSRHVVVHDLRSMRPTGEPRHVQGKGGDDFELFARDGRVWVNDPDQKELMSFDREGKVVTFAPDDLSNGPEGGRSQRPATGVPPVTRRPSPGTDIGDPTGRPNTTRNGGDDGGSTGQRGGDGQRGTGEGEGGTPAREPDDPPRPLVVVPPVVGQPAAQAEAEIRRARLRARSVSLPGNCVSGTVTASDPGAGTRVKRDSLVVLRVCGPARVPPVTGLTIDQAHQTLQNARFQWRDVPGGVAQNPADIGRVIAQDPRAPREANTGTTITLTYIDPARGSGVVVPSVQSMNPDQACQTLQALSLACAGKPDEVTWQTNVVHGQSPNAGTQVPAGTGVEYIYETVAPSGLRRYKARGNEARHLSVNGAHPGEDKWADMQVIGGAYSAGERGVPGLVDIYQFVCDSNCGDPKRDIGRYYSRNAAPPNARWQATGPAFACLTDPVPGTKPLVTMRSEQLNSWAFAPKDSEEYNWHADPNHGAYTEVSTLCHIWFGVGGFRG
ncbi:PASTA domain-containing protein [Actinomadura rubrisoli]|uniref:PASTA domain-containing protein n=1 Tax=Actinomadura rubrisoli TaxID=2530368 RepID=A0A4R5C6G9_9ACTN|nr:PASTA domain-containing protein [Actinomadura rubrisoli]TDD92502.1 PASTA domain-containing protein [Actinomadura rubrisoli]